MTNLRPTTALGGTTPFEETIGGLHIVEMAAPVMASLAMLKGASSAFGKAAESKLGALPEPGTIRSHKKTCTIWMGPDQYLVEGMDASSLSTAFGSSAAITDQSDAWARFDVTGDNVLAMLERLSNADSRRMSAGAATRTAIHHMHCVIICRTAGTNFTVLGPRSSAGSLHHALVAAAASL